IVHFCCHGVVDHDEPLDSLILLSDWEEKPFTLRQVIELSLSASRLAFLSACFTAHGGAEELQDESNHLACGFHLAGFDNVIGSLWLVGDNAAYEVMTSFYDRLATCTGELTSTNIAIALHSAVRQFRDNTKTPQNEQVGNPLRWAPFIHLG
ncbi:hypothetical protein K458DRAFT_268588, partial [Lentithecium fluviatile CBS 122367]